LRKRCVLSPEQKREGVIDGESGGDDSVNPACVNGKQVKDQDVNKAHGKNEGVYSLILSVSLMHILVFHFLTTLHMSDPLHVEKKAL